MLHEESDNAEVLHYEASKVAWATADLVRQAPSMWAVSPVYLLIAAVAIGALYGWFSIVPVSISTPGILVNAQKTYPMLATRSSRVKLLNVENNQRVKKGDLLLVSDDHIPASILQALKQQIAQTSVIIDRDEANRCDRSCLRSLAKLSATAFSAEVASPLKEEFVTIRELMRDYTLAKDQALNSYSLVAEQNRQIRDDEHKLEILKNKDPGKLFAFDEEVIRREIGTLQTSIHERQAALQSSETATRDRLQVRMQGLESVIADFQRETEVHSPVDGIVNNLSVSGVGQTLSAGTTLMEVIPIKSELLVELTVANQDISRLAVGMPVRVKIDALPENTFGAADGTISNIPPNIAAMTDPRAPASYKVSVKLKAQKFMRDEQSYPFRLGMTLQALIITKRERLLVLGVKRILKFKDSLFE